MSDDTISGTEPGEAAELLSRFYRKQETDDVPKSEELQRVDDTIAANAEGVEAVIGACAMLRQVARLAVFTEDGEPVRLTFLNKIATLVELSERSGRLALKALRDSTAERDRLLADIEALKAGRGDSVG